MWNPVSSLLKLSKPMFLLLGSLGGWDRGFLAQMSRVVGSAADVTESAGALASSEASTGFELML